MKNIIKLIGFFYRINLTYWPSGGVCVTLTIMIFSAFYNTFDSKGTYYFISSPKEILMKAPRWIFTAITVFILAGCIDPELGTDTDAQNVTNELGTDTDTQNVTNSESSGVALKWNEGNWNETDWK